MRIIDADAYYESLKDTLDEWDGDEAEDVLIRNAHRAWIKKLNNAPSINICFCKDCKHLREEGVTSDKDYYCDRCHDTYGYWREVKLDDFCSYGERSSG